MGGIIAVDSDYSAALAGRKKKSVSGAAVVAARPDRPDAMNGGGGYGGGGRQQQQHFAPPGRAGVDALDAPPCGCGCGCGVAAKQLTVSKEGPNKGRKFFSCVKSRYFNLIR